MRSADYYRAVVIGDHENGQKDVHGEARIEEGDAYREAAKAKEEFPELEIIIQRSSNGKDGPWLRY